MSNVLLKCTGAAIIGSFVESKYASKFLDSGTVPVTSNTIFGLSPWTGLTPLILLGTSFWTVSFGMKVGAARRKYREQAIKDDEPDVAARYDLPNLYAQGTSKNARAFNCVQRAHQQIHETLNVAIFSAMIAAVNYPFTSALSALVYSVGRVVFSNGYADGDGDASKRYSHPLARYMWHGLVTNLVLGALSCVSFISNKKLLW